MKKRQDGSVLLAEFKAGYNRTGEITINEGVCDVCCGQERIVVLVDSSTSFGMSEYSPGAICLECVQKGIEAYKKFQS